MNKIWRVLKDVPVYLLVIFICGELALRFIYGHTDEDWNFLFGYYWLRPCHLPIKQAEEFGHPPPGEKRYIDYDPLLRWAPVVGGSFLDGLYHHGKLGHERICPHSKRNMADFVGGFIVGTGWRMKREIGLGYRAKVLPGSCC